MQSLNYAIKTRPTVTRLSSGYKSKFEQDQDLPNILLKWDKQN